MKPQLRRSPVAHDLDIAPQHTLRMAGAKRFHRRLFRREPTGKMGSRVTASRGVSDLTLGEDTAHESIAVSRNHRLDAINFGRIHSDPDNIRGHGATQA